MSVKIFDYQGSPIQFDEVNGVIMANASLMAKAFNKRPDDIFKTIQWKEYEKALIQLKGLNYEDLRSLKEGVNGGSWIHQELVIEFARRLNPLFSIWCNDKISELIRTGKAELKPLSIEEMMIMQLQGMIETKKDVQELKDKVKIIEAKQETSPTNYYAVSGYASLRKINVDKNTAQKVGKAAAGICKDLGYVMGSVPDAKYGSVKTYPIDVLDSVFKDFRLIA